jgi:hypothetical protein
MWAEGDFALCPLSQIATGMRVMLLVEPNDALEAAGLRE